MVIDEPLGELKGRMCIELVLNSRPIGKDMKTRSSGTVCDLVICLLGVFKCNITRNKTNETEVRVIQCLILYLRKKTADVHTE